MKKLIYFLFTIALISLIACSKEDDPSDDSPDNLVTMMKKYEKNPVLSILMLSQIWE